MSNKARNKRAKIARETLDIIEKGYYKNTKGEVVDIKDDIVYSINNSVLYSPEDGEKIVEKIKENNLKVEKYANSIFGAARQGRVI